MNIQPLNATFFVLFLLSFTLQSVEAQGIPDEQRFSIDSLFSQWSKADSPGCSVAIYKDGELAYSQGYGMSNLEYNIPIIPQSIFHVASVSKQFTDFAILLLEEEGKLSIEDDIRKHLPEIHDFEKTITIRHLMNHTSGFRDQWELLAISGWRLDDVITKDHIMKMILGQRELNFDPGEEYMYCNAGYSILARIVDRVSGVTFREFAQERIFKPLQMNNTHVHDDHEMIVPNRSYSYYQNEGGFKKSVLSYANDGATSLFTTSEDMVKWIENMINPQLGESFIDEMLMPGILNNGDTLAYALGLSIGEYKGLRFAGHGGADAGFRSNIRWYPEKDFGVAVLSNLASFNPSQKVNQITDIILKEDLVQESIEEEPKDEKTKISLGEKELSKFAGKYSLVDMGVNFTIALNEGILELTQEWDNTKYNIFPIATDRFIEENNIGLEFNFKKDGDKYDVINIAQGGNNFVAKRYVEQKFEEGYYEQFIGKYFNSETQAVYHVIKKEDGIIVTHMRHNDIPLTPLEDNVFRGNAWWFGKVEFTKDVKGSVDGFLLTGGRVRNLKFSKD